MPFTGILKEEREDSKYCDLDCRTEQTDDKMELLPRFIKDGFV
ncbi:hypothetical protein [Porphyromonas canoris]|nr:hypothetical protein [Porphyromonas canoris]